MTLRYWAALACCALALGAAQDLAGQAADDQGRTYRLSGVVTDAAREPISEVEVTVVSITPERTASTDARGRFDLGQFYAGPLSFRVRRIGYEQRLVQVEIGSDGQPTNVELVLLPIVEELEGVYIGASPQGRLREFYQRRQQRGTFGRFLEADEIRRLGPRHASDLFRNVPGIRLTASPGGGNQIRIRGCQPMVLVDGQRVPGAELDEVILPGDIAAIEFYPSAAGIPAQYLERNNRLCGLVLVWTKAE